MDYNGRFSVRHLAKSLGTTPQRIDRELRLLGLGGRLGLDGKPRLLKKAHASAVILAILGKRAQLQHKREAQTSVDPQIAQPALQTDPFR